MKVSEMFEGENSSLMKAYDGAVAPLESIESLLKNGYELCHAKKGQIFWRDGWYLTKDDEQGLVKDIFYVDEYVSKLTENHYKQGYLRGLEEADRFVREEMDKTEHQTNAEFIACDELAINIIKRLSQAHDAISKLKQQYETK